MRVFFNFKNDEILELGDNLDKIKIYGLEMLPRKSSRRMGVSK